MFLLPWLVLILGSLLFTGALPNPLFLDGLPVLGILALIPVFWFTRISTWPKALLGGAVWGLASFGLSCYWLTTFHPLAMLVVLIVVVPESAVLFLISRFLWRAFPSAPWLQALVWTAFEYLRTLGFLGFPFGLLASSFHSLPLLIQTADLFGTGGLSFFLGLVGGLAARHLPVPGEPKTGSKAFFLQDAISIGGVGLGLVIYGAFQLAGVSSLSKTAPVWRPALIQHVQDPWKGGPEAYEEGLDKLLDLSVQALQAKPDAVVWSETAFVPSVFYHEKYRDNADSFRLVRRLETFLEAQTLPFVLGNDHREKDSATSAITDFNAVLLWNAGWKGLYEKTRLVPFTESFPYKAQFPWVYKLLLDADTHFWQPGREFTVFDLGAASNGAEVKAGTPICFEDSFGDLDRRFVLAGANVLVNLTNDSWSGSKAAMRQHYALSVFRAVENHRSLLRAANSGTTAAVGPDGSVRSRLSEGEPGVLQTEVPLVAAPLTLYTRWGDWFSLLVSGLLAVFVVLGVFRSLKPGPAGKIR